MLFNSELKCGAADRFDFQVIYSKSCQIIPVSSMVTFIKEWSSFCATAVYAIFLVTFYYV